VHRLASPRFPPLTAHHCLSIDYYYQRYRSTVQRIARGSLLLAAMTPHVLFASVAVGLKLLLPRLITWLATETSVTSLLSWWYPVGATITLLHQISQEGKEPDIDDKNSNNNHNSIGNGTLARPAAEEKENNANSKPQRKPTKTSTTSPKPRKPCFPRTAPASSSSTREAEEEDRGKSRRRRSFFLPSTPRFHHDNPAQEVHEWLQYWMVYASVQAVARLLYLLPGSSLWRYGTSVANHSFLLPAGSQLQLLFYIWIYVLPYTVLPIPDLPDTKPLFFLTDYMIRPTILSLTEAVSGAISLSFWERHVVGKVTALLDALVMIRFVKRATADWCWHVVHSMRHTAVPSITLLMPGMVTNYGVLYVQYAVPLSVAAAASTITTTTTMTNVVARHKKTNDTNTNQKQQQQQQLLLQYWVLHALTQGILEQCSSILWWIPLSTHFTFVLWCYWNLDVSVRQWYPAVQQELQAFGLLPGEMVQTWESTRTSRIFNMVLARLPSAAANDTDDTDGKNATATTTDGNNTDNDVKQDPLLQDEDGGMDDDGDEEQEEYVPDTDHMVSTPARGAVTRRSTRQRKTSTTAN
jgi:hypothetical protein